MIHADDVARVREEADAVTIIGSYVKLRRSGNSHRGPCPFHNGKHDNLSVRDRYFRCFVCGAQGDTFTFLEKRLGLDFAGAVRHVAETLGIQLREAEGPTRADPRAPLWQVNEAARDCFQSNLTTAGALGADYLASRSLSTDDAERFQLGWAPRSTTGWHARLNTLGFDDARLIVAGLLVDGNGAGKVKGRFWERVMFPIRDLNGNLAGFAGRRIDDGEPKYLNSPEGPAFSKRELLYNLHQAKAPIRKAGRIIVVEGYMDVIRLVLAGVGEVVAPMGTAMTPDQAKLIRRFASTAYLIYDRDQAGLKATFRAGRELLAAGVSVRVVTLPEGYDPDSFALAYGAAGIEEEIGMGSIDVFDRQIEILDAAGCLATTAKKREAFNRLLPTIVAAADPITRGLYIARAAEAIGVSDDTVRQSVAVAARER